MALNICDAIERFLLESLGEEHSVLLSRNSLAAHFDCAPSQINYVLSTRFTPERGFLTTSRRGGGGYIEIVRADGAGDVGALLRGGLGEELPYNRARGILDALQEKNTLTPRETRFLLAALSDAALSCSPVKDKLRARILKNILLEMVKEEDEG